MRRRWIISLLTACSLILAICVHPSPARLNPGNFVPYSRLSSYFGEPTINYRIQKGDTLWKISRQYNVNLASLMVVNKLGENAILEVGQVLTIPGASGIVHVVDRGETMWDIARHYQVSVEAISKANNNRNPNRLNIGDRLIIPGSRPYSAVAVLANPSRGLALPLVLSWPLVGTITSSFGWRSSGYHHGIDLANDVGTPIRAAAAGRVVFAGYKAVYGRTVIIEHESGKQTLYAHAQDILVKSGQKVSRGQKIATVGTSGRSTGPHLHFEIREGDTFLDPLRYLRR